MPGTDKKTSQEAHRTAAQVTGSEQIRIAIGGQNYYFTVNDLANALGILGFIPINNYNATADPTTGDDSGDGYSKGSEWLNNNNQTLFKCADATLGAAVWYPISFN